MDDQNNQNQNVSQEPVVSPAVPASELANQAISGPHAIDLSNLNTVATQVASAPAGAEVNAGSKEDKIMEKLSAIEEKVLAIAAKVGA